MVYDVVHLFGVELVQYGHSHGTIGDGSQECYAPTAHVTAADSHLVALFYAALGKDNVQLCNLFRHVAVLEGALPVIRHRGQAPMLSETVFYDFI